MSYGIVTRNYVASDDVLSQRSATMPLLSNSSSTEGERRSEGGHASVISCVGNLTNTIIGTGMLTFPLSVASSGLLPGILSCFVSGCIGGFGLYLLSFCAARVGHRRASFFAVSQITFPKAALFFDLAIAVKCFGVSISYLIIIKGLMPSVVHSLYYDLFSREPPQWSSNGRTWVTIFMGILIPLCWLRRLDSLRHVSYIGIFAAVYLVFIVAFCYFFPIKNMPEPGPVYWLHFTPNFISTFPVQVFAYTCAQNLFPIYNEVTDNSQPRMNTIIGSSIGFAIIAYEIISIFGYLTFGSRVGSNIIAMYPSSSLFIALGQFAIVITVLFSYPLQVHPCRNCLGKVFSKEVVSPKAISHVEIETENDEEEEERPLGSSDISTLKHTILTSCIIGAGFLIAFFVNDLQMSSTGSTTISFILPGLFFWKLFRDDVSQSKYLVWASIGLIMYGVLIFIFCLSYNIYQAVQD